MSLQEFSSSKSRKRQRSYKNKLISMESQIKWLQQNVQDRDELIQAIKDEINVPETQIPIETEENISKKSDCNVPLINTVHNDNNPSPPFSEFEKQKGKLSRKERKEVRQIMRKVERIEKEQQEIDKRIEKEQQEIDKINAERKVQKHSCKLFCIMTFITLCFTNFTLRIIMEVCGIGLLLKLTLTLIENAYPLSPDVIDNRSIALHDDTMICDHPTCPSETCKQIRYAGLRRLFFTP